MPGMIAQPFNGKRPVLIYFTQDGDIFECYECIENWRPIGWEKLPVISPLEVLAGESYQVVKHPTQRRHYVKQLEEQILEFSKHGIRLPKFI